MGKQIAVELHNIKKHFGTVRANDGVDLIIRRGEIHAILGENGSGKSTLMNILSGLYNPDSGTIEINGEPVKFTSPRDAIDAGIGMIHQHFKLVEALTAWENIVGGMESGLFLNKVKVVRQIRELCEKYSLQMNPEKRIHDMTIGEKQTVEIVKALYRGADVLILDEPTAVLTVQEIDKLFNILREIRDNGCAVIIITHKLQEVMDISDRVTVLRKGRSITSINTEDAGPREMAEMMVGREVDIEVPYVETDESSRENVLEIRGLKVAGAEGVLGLDIDSLDIRSYEIMGIAGIADSGQKELCEAITGLVKATGSIRLKGQELIGLNPKTMAKEGIEIGFVPEDRLGMGLVGGMSITDNVALRLYKKTKGLLLDKKELKDQAQKLVENYNVSTPGVDQTIKSLSGGNIQKILLGREIDRETELLITAYPVRGLDIGATDYIYEKLNEEKKKGVAILLIGEDLDTLIGICDKIAVLHAGQIMEVVDAKKTSKEELGLLMVGMGKEDVESA